jgi:hypothetical protein
MGTHVVLETSAILNLARLITWKYFINLSRHESFSSYSEQNFNVPIPFDPLLSLSDWKLVQNVGRAAILVYILQKDNWTKSANFPKIHIWPSSFQGPTTQYRWSIFHLTSSYVHIVVITHCWGLESVRLGLLSYQCIWISASLFLVIS